MQPEFNTQAFMARYGHRVFALLLVVGDFAVAVAAVLLAYVVRFDGRVTDPFRGYMLGVALLVGCVVPLVFALTGLYRYVWRQVGVGMLVKLGLVVVGLASGGLMLDVVFSSNSASGTRVVPIGVVIIAATFLFIGTGVMRALSRMAVFVRARSGASGGRRVVIVGAGDAGALLLRDIETQPGLGLQVVGLLDDDPGKKGRYVRSARILGTVSEIEKVVAERDVAEVLVAIPSASHDAQARILDACASAGVPVRVMPGLARAASHLGVRDLREVHIKDLLGREPAEVDMVGIKATIQGRVALVTGAAGSIGSELCRQLLVAEPQRLILIDIDESRLYELFLELEDLAPGISEMRICDIRDDRKLVEVFREYAPEIVLHAAAYKHVPLMEIEPDEAVKTNIVGTRNVIEACERARVHRFVLISTDKAVRPQSIMGTTKAIAERMMIDACRRGLHASGVRFGNVLGSRGSVIPLFEEQLKRGGSLRVTHPDVTRYFMTIPEAARLVLQAQALSDGGDIFVLEMGDPVRIVDLAEKMIALSGSDAQIEFTGLRPAEKLHEILTTESEDLVETTAKKVARLNAIPLPDPQIEGIIRELATAARVNDRFMLQAGFSRLLPEFETLGIDALRYVDEESSAEHIPVIDSEMETLL